MRISRWFICLSFLFLSLGAQAADTEGNWTLNLRDVDVRVFLEQFAAISGEHFVVDPEVKGKVSVISSTPLNAKSAHEVFLTVLRVNGLAALPAGDVTRIVPQANAKLGQENGGSGQALVTRVLPVKNGNVAEAVKLLKPLVSPGGYIEGSDYSNAVIVSDYADNVRTLARTLARLGQDENQPVEIIPLKQAWVGNIVPLLEAVAPMDFGGKGPNRLRVIADEMSNSIVVRGDASDRAKIRALVETFDQKTPNASGIQMIPLHYADAKDVANVLKGMLGGKADAQSSRVDRTAPAVSPGTPGSDAPVLPAQSNAPEEADTTSNFIQADVSLNTIIVRATPSRMSEIRALVRQLDVRRPQVLIEAAIVEISADKSEALGVQLGGGDLSQTLNGGISQFSNSGISIANLLTALGSPNAANIAAEGASIAIGEHNQFNLLIQALANTSGANLLSTPSIITLDNEPAKIVVGQNVPFRTGSFSTQAAGTTNPFTTIERQDIGVTLKVSPQIHDGDVVRLTIEQEVSSIAPTQNAGAADIITNKRIIQTKILAQDGETVVLGGLMEDDTSVAESKVPLLGDIPVLGALFRSHSQSYAKKNLLVFLRPTVLRSRAEMAGVTQERYSRIYDLETGQRELGSEDSNERAPVPVPPASTIFDTPSKTLPWLVAGHNHPSPPQPPVQPAVTPQTDAFLPPSRQPDTVQNAPVEPVAVTSVSGASSASEEAEALSTADPAFTIRSSVAPLPAPWQKP